MADPALTTTCLSCGMFEQHCGMACGFCGDWIPVPAEALAPDGTARVEEVIGWRGWKIAYADDGSPRLNSPLYALVWEPGEWMVATCRQCDDDPSLPNYHGPNTDDPARWSPVKGCGGGGHGCGFYAGRTREHLMKLRYNRYTENDPHVIGEVQMAGKIIPATNGFRAQKVRPRRIYVPYEFWKLAAALKEVYEPHACEVVLETTLVLPTTTDLKWCKKCTAPLHRQTTCGLCGYEHI